MDQIYIVSSCNRVNIGKILYLEYMEAREFIAETLSFDVDVDVNLFECTIRVLGSMLSAFHLTHDELYKDRAVSLLFVLC